jgi:hypothetical protein
MIVCAVYFSIPEQIRRHISPFSMDLMTHTLIHKSRQLFLFSVPSARLIICFLAFPGRFLLSIF